MSEHSELHELVGALRDISERLVELAIGELKAAIEQGETTRPNAERVLNRARSGIERAAALIEGLTRSES